GLVDTVYAEGIAAGQPLTRPAGEDLAALVPLADPHGIVATSCHPLDGHYDPAAATRHFADQLAPAGVTLLLRTTARRIRTHPDHSVAGIHTSHGTITTPILVVAAGIWTRHLSRTVGVDIPFQQRSVTLGRTTPATPGLFAPVLQHSEFTAWQREDGRIVLGTGLIGRDTVHLPPAALADPDVRRHLRANRHATRIRPDLTGTTRHTPDHIPDTMRWYPPDRSELTRALKALHRAVPATSSVKIEHTWTGILDTTPDALPVLDTTQDVPGLTVLAGMSGHGMAIGPVTGTIGAHLALGKDTGFDLTAFRHRRFDRPRRATASRPG
ncbi:FAD-dependent oxidoreductase, partial [Nakamurella sp. YIM 132087]